MNYLHKDTKKHVKVSKAINGFILLSKIGGVLTIQRYKKKLTPF